MIISTEQDIKNLIPAEKQTVYSIKGSKGLKLYVLPSGKKVFKLKFLSKANTYSTLFLGEWSKGVYGIQEAIKDASVELARVAIRRVPNINRKFKDFGEFWERYKFETAESRSKLKTIDEIISRFERILLPKIKDIPIAVLREPDKARPKLLDALKSIQTPENPRMTTLVKVMNQLNICLDHAALTGVIAINPARIISSNFKNYFITVKSEPRKAILNIDDLQQFFAAINNYFGDPIVKDCMKWTIMYAVRPTNARTAKWSQIDFKNKEWRIEGSNMKMGEDFILPLTDTAIKFLKNLHNYKYQAKEYIFSSVGCTKPMSEGTMRMALNRMGFKGEVHMHGFRSTFRTLMSEMNFEKKLGLTEEVLSLCIDHKFRKVVRSDEAYHRAKFEDGKRKAFVYWHKKLKEWGLDI